MAKFPALDEKFPRIVPSFRELVKIMSECVAGGVSLNCTAFEFRQCDAALGTLLGKFMEVLRLKELPPEQNESIDELILLFTRLSADMSKLETALSMDATAAAQTCINNIYKNLKELEESNMTLKAAVRDRHLYSEVPVVDSLLRAGHSVIDSQGTEWESLGARLEALLPRWNEIVSGEGLPEEFAKHDRALDKLVNVLNERNLEGLPAVLEEVKQSGEALTKYEESQYMDPEAERLICPYCGKRMLEGSKKCFACGGRIPEPFEGGQGGPNQERNRETKQGAYPDYIQRILDLASELPANPGLLRPFKRAVGELRRRVADANSRLTKISNTKLKTTPEERERIDGLVDLANNSLVSFSEAVGLLENFETPVDRFHLQCALEVLTKAVEELRGVGGLAHKYGIR